MAGNSGYKRGRKEEREVDKTKYSVLMSVYCKEDPVCFKKSIESMMGQTVKPDQFVLVCDGPLTSELDKIAGHFREAYPEVFLVLRLEKCGGLGPALQKGLGECRNELIARMDSDDVSRPERCEKQLDVFKRRQVDIVGGVIEEFASDITRITGRRVTPETDGEIRRCVRRRNPFNHVTVMYKKNAVLQVGGYQDFPYFEDYFLWARMLKNGSQGYNIQQPLVYVRTGQEMFSRRGGLAYARLAVKFRWYLKKSGISGWNDFFVAAAGQTLVCVLPNGLREKFYKVILRKSK